MNIAAMHYDFKSKMNKIDSHQNRNFLIPEIDWLLNEAQELYVKMIAEPRQTPNINGFEISQRNRDSIRPLVVNVRYVTNILQGDEDGTYIIELPEDYMFFIRARADIQRDICTIKDAIIRVREHDDEFEESEFDKSSFEWGEINCLFTSDGIKLYTDNFTITDVRLSYIRKPRIVHYAQGFRGGQYLSQNGIMLTGTSDCELPEYTHREIVDLAVAIATTNISSQDYSLKFQKLQFNNLQ